MGSNHLYLPSSVPFQGTKAVQSASVTSSSGPLNAVLPGSVLTLTFASWGDVHVVVCSFAKSAIVNGQPVDLNIPVGSFASVTPGYGLDPIPSPVGTKAISLASVPRPKRGFVGITVEVTLRDDVTYWFDPKVEAEAASRPGVQTYRGPWISIHNPIGIQGWWWYQAFNIITPLEHDRDARLRCVGGKWVVS